MKKFVLLIAAGMLAATGFVLAPASADDAALNTPIGNAGSGEAGEALILDGATGNPDPADGYISVSEDGTVSCEADGGPYNDDGTSVNDDDNEDNDWAPSGECDPSDSVPPLPVPAP